MPASTEIGKALGKLFRNLTNPKWVATEAGKAAATIIVVNPLGQRVKAYIMHHLHHEEHIGDVYEDADGNEYMVVKGGKTYRYNTRTDSWHPAE